MATFGTSSPHGNGAVCHKPHFSVSETMGSPYRVPLVPLPSPERFTLLPGNWYAAEFIGDEYEDDCRGFSPIRVLKVESMTKRRLSLSFYHANYPEGVRDKTYLLATIQRGRRFLLARCLVSEQVRFLLIHTLTSRWLRERFNSSFDAPEHHIGGWLDRNA